MLIIFNSSNQQNLIRWFSFPPISHYPVKQGRLLPGIQVDQNFQMMIMLMFSFIDFLTVSLGGALIYFPMELLSFGQLTIVLQPFRAQQFRVVRILFYLDCSRILP